MFIEITQQAIEYQEERKEQLQVSYDQRKIPNVCQKPGPTDLSDGIMTPSMEKNLTDWNTSHSQARLTCNTHCKRQWSSFEKKKACAETNSNEFPLRDFF